MEYWAKPGLDRLQTLLLYPTLDESVSEYHPVRQLEEILRALDWSGWTQEYNGRVGQPPIPPWVMAGVILYGLMRRIRSSRQLEYACGHNIDFMWLAEGRTIDHCTFCDFRTQVQGAVEAIVQAGRPRGDENGVHPPPGSRFRRHACQGQRQSFSHLDGGKSRSRVAGTGNAGRRDAQGGGDGRCQRGKPCGTIVSSQALPPELADARKRQEKCGRCWKNSARPTRRGRRTGSRRRRRCPRPTRIPRVMPNKEGGYAPNYTPVVATDGTGDFIVDCEVIPGPNEQNELLPSTSGHKF